ncbi:hypothetical protein OG453_23660 [Streptomyces sp. NBC_01381]|uniref:hypothetical protein n=1 Tax=Streptomyces sp. NBC_01381 TaxID=2903845 RepID=UPI0022504A5C|nr:hypothetical protein [Streptomyces sp. NBC_01381]MCX4669644.1 hypothetical protein [Streptomyces sp. NBC_01381]
MNPHHYNEHRAQAQEFTQAAVAEATGADSAIVKALAGLTHAVLHLAETEGRNGKTTGSEYPERNLIQEAIDSVLASR